MKHFFDYDGTLNQILTKVMYVVALNLLFLLCSVPIVTVGASCTAMYTVLLRYLRGDEPDIVKGFFRAFRDNFRTATAVWLVMLAVAATLGYHFYFLYHNAVAGSGAIRVLLVLVLLLWLVLWVWLFPAMAYFDNTVRGYLTFAVGIAVARLPDTVLLVLLQTVPVLAVLFLAQYVPMATLLLLCCGASLPAYWSGGRFLHLFSRYEG